MKPSPRRSRTLSRRCVLAAALLAFSFVGCAESGTLALKGKGAGPSPSIPAYINAPTVGTDLTAVWNLQFAGTGPRSAPTNGTWPAGLTPGVSPVPTYLAGLGFTWANHDGAIVIDIGSSTVTISNYDFTLCTGAITAKGTGTLILNDCVLPKAKTFLNASIAFPYDVNGNPQNQLITVQGNYCLFDLSTFYGDTGTILWSHCRFKNQTQGIGDTGGVNLKYDWCWISGGGCNPPPNSHVEFTRFGTTIANPDFQFNNSIVTLSDGQASLGPIGPPSYGYTGIWSLGGGLASTASSANSVFIGLAAVNANPNQLNVLGEVFGYTDGSVTTITNCAIQRGSTGYTTNLNASTGGTLVCIDGGGNRNTSNQALTVVNFWPVNA